VTPDHACFALLGAVVSQALTIALAFLWRLRANRGGFWAQATRDDE
jgi:ABC-type branched-subunit amino acid transport system permease subunit